MFGKTKQLNEFTLTDGDESITVSSTADGIAQGLAFKADHIKARADHEFFEAAVILIDKLSKENSALRNFIAAYF